MRRLSGLLSIVICASCADAPEQDPDAVATQSDVQESSISLADVAGEWHVQAMPEDRDTVVTTYQLWAADDTLWRMKFDHQEDTLLVHVLAVEGDSIRAQVGPYSSALRPGVNVMTFAMYRLAGDTLHGRAVAHYNVSTPDSVRLIRTKGTRVQ